MTSDQTTAAQTTSVGAHASPATSTTPLADPGSLGLAAFALTTFVLSVANAGMLDSSAAVLGLALFYGGIAQIVAGIWEFANRNTFGATAFTSYGAFWLAFWYLQTTPSGTDAGAAGVGVFLLAWGIFTAYMTVAARKTNGSIFAVFVALTLTFFALAFGDFTENLTLHRIGGWLGIITALLAWYGSFAVVLNSTSKRTVLPVWPSKQVRCCSNCCCCCCCWQYWRNAGRAGVMQNAPVCGPIRSGRARAHFVFLVWLSTTTNRRVVDVAANG